MNRSRPHRLLCIASWFALTAVLHGQIIDTRIEPANIALGAFADTNGSLYSGSWTPDILVDGDRGNVIHGDGPGGVTGAPEEPGFSYTIDLGETIDLDGIALFPRQGCCPDRLKDFRVSVLASDQSEAWGVDLFADNDATSRVNLGAADGVGTFSGRYIVVTTNQDPVEEYELQLTEIEVYSGGGGVEVPINYALGAEAFTNGSLWSPAWSPAILTDGARNIVHGDGAGGVTGLAEDEGFYYEIDLGQEIELAEVHILPRQDGCCPERLTNYLVTVHDDVNGSAGEAVWAGIYRDDLSTPDTFDPDVITADGDPGGRFVGQWIRVTSLASQDDIDDGLVDYRLQMSEIEVYGHLGSGLIGDFDGSGVLDAADIDILSEAVRDGLSNAEYDLDGNGSVGAGDRAVWVEQLRGTYFGDANLDSEFNSGDFVAVFTAGQYEDNVPNNSTWASGDWDGDGDFGSGDFVFAFTGGGYENGPRVATAAAVPEPNTFALLAVGLLGCVSRQRRR